MSQVWPISYGPIWLLFPASPYTSLTLSAEGGAARMEHLTVYPLGTAE